MQLARRTFTTAEVMKPALRASILQSEISPAEKELYDFPFDEWGRVDRARFAGFRAFDPHPVDPMSCAPVDSEHPLLRKLALFSGPVTKLAADGIVNAANEFALGGGGVDGAIHAAAGRLLRRECATFPCCPTGQCFITKGYMLPARYVLHTVGPIGEKPYQLRSCYRSVLSLAKAHKLRTLGVCGISTGVYGYPLRPATKIAIHEIMGFLQENGEDVDRICLACFTHDEKTVAEAAIAEWKRESALS